MSQTPPPGPARSRREFLRTAAITGAGLASLPAVPTLAGIRTRNKSGLGNPVLGSGEHTYECIHDWARLPAGYRFGNTHGVCEDSLGRIHIKHTVGAGSSSDDAIAVFDGDGKFIRSWGAEFKGGAHGLHINREGNQEFLYLCDPPRGLLVKTTLDGEDVWRRACPLESGLYNSPGEYHPTNVAVAPSGDIYCADGYGKSWIHVYNAKGEYTRSFGGPGKERGQVSCPHGLMVDSRGKSPRLVVADRSNRRLQYFTLDGRHEGFVTDEMRAPCHFHTRGEVMVVPDLEARVTLLDKDNKLIVHLGDGENYALRDKPREQFIPGRFIAPHSAYFDHQGSIFVVEWVEVGRVTKLKRV
ncbi:MAG: hypothetical protein IT436_10655 [Phycisphaerales bacterium]|nr:hypothetical protein [Phycisphaerales bacterium]